MSEHLVSKNHVHYTSTLGQMFTHVCSFFPANIPNVNYAGEFVMSRSQWPRGLRRRSLAARLLRLWVRIPPGVWIFVCCECCVLSGRGLCDGLIIRSEESYRMWRVVVCDQETS